MNIKAIIITVIAALASSGLVLLFGQIFLPTASLFNMICLGAGIFSLVFLAAITIGIFCAVLYRFLQEFLTNE